MIAVLSNLVEHLSIHLFDLVHHLHVLGVGQPIQQLLLVVYIAIVVQRLRLAEIGQSWRFPVSKLLCHQTVTALDDFYSVLGRFIVNQLEMAQDLRGIRVVFYIYGEMRVQ